MKYLKVFTDFAKTLDALGDAEIGRLFKAMLLYAETGEESDLRGNERILWGTAKMNIDRERNFCVKQTENGAKGGRPKKPKETQNNPKKPKETQKSQKDKDKDKDISKETHSNECAKKSGFQPPTPEEVQAYCDQRGNGISGEAFVAYYASQKWTKANGRPLDNWKQAVITWEQREKEKRETRKTNRAVTGYAQQRIADEQIEHMVVDLSEDT